MVFRLPDAQLSSERSVFVLFKVKWDLIQFVFKVPLLWAEKRGFSLEARKADAGVCCSVVIIAAPGNTALEMSS